MPTAADVALRRGRFHQCRRCGTNAWLEHSEYAKVGGKSLPHPCREETTEHRFDSQKSSACPRWKQSPGGQGVQPAEAQNQRHQKAKSNRKYGLRASCSAREPNRLNQRLASAPWRLPQWIYSRTSPTQRSPLSQPLCKSGQRAVAVSEHKNFLNIATTVSARRDA